MWKEVKQMMMRNYIESSWRTSQAKRTVSGDRSSDCRTISGRGRHEKGMRHFRSGGTFKSREPQKEN